MLVKECTPKVKTHAKNEHIKIFVDMFMYIAYLLFPGDHRP